MLYGVAATALKTASNRGCGIVRTMCVCNWLTGLAFLAFYDWSLFPSLPDPWWPSVVLAMLFVLGSFFTVFALSHGDVSVATPVLGVKVVMVAFMVAFVLGVDLEPRTWVASIFAVLGIVSIQINDRPHDRGKIVVSVVFALLATACFGAFDTMNQHWSPRVGFANLVPPGMVVASVLSLAFIPMLKGRVRDLSGKALLYLGIGAGLMTVQAVILIWSIGTYQDAAGANVVFGSRGLWSVVFVWLFGQRFGNVELKQRHPKVVWARIGGAILICAAIVLMFTG